MNQERTTTMIIDSTKKEAFLNQFEWLKKSVGASHIYLDMGEFSEPYLMGVENNGYREVVSVEIKNLTYIGNSGDQYIGRNIKSSCEKFSIDTVQPMPGINPEDLLVLDNVCDHCGSRRNRNSYYFFKKLDGSIIKVGSSCVKEYFGYDVNTLVERWLSIKEHWSTLPYSNKDVAYRIEDIYSAVKEATNDFKNDWDKVETKQNILNIIKNGPKSVIISEVRSSIEKIKNTVKYLSKDMKDNIMSNLIMDNGKVKQVFKSNEIIQIAWAIQYAEKKTTELEEFSFESGEFVGSIGDKIRIAGTLYYDCTLNDNFGGYSNKYSLRGIDGNNYEFYTKKDVIDITSGEKKSVMVMVEGILGKHIEKTMGKYAGILFNRLKGRIKITEIKNN